MTSAFEEMNSQQGILLLLVRDKKITHEEAGTLEIVPTIEEWRKAFRNYAHELVYRASFLLDKTKEHIKHINEHDWPGTQESAEQSDQELEKVSSLIAIARACMCAAKTMGTPDDDQGYWTETSNLVKFRRTQKAPDIGPTDFEEFSAAVRGGKYGKGPVPEEASMEHVYALLLPKYYQPLAPLAGAEHK